MDKIKYHINTCNGISEASYTNTKEEKIYGTSQGNGASAPIWTYTSTVLMDGLCERHTGMKFVSPDSKLSISQPIGSIVDDTMIGSK